MSESEETDLLQILKDNRVETVEYRRANDEVNERFRNDLMQEVGALIEEVRAIKIVVKENTKSIAKFDKYEDEISGAAKFGKAVLSFLIGLSVVGGVLWGFLTSYFKH